MTKYQIRKAVKDYHQDKIDYLQWKDFMNENYEYSIDIMIAYQKMSSAQDRLEEYKKSNRFLYKIRKYCNYHGYTDIHPFEVIRVINKKTIEVRAMDTIQTKHPKEFHAGGFLGHYSDVHNQAYEYISNENNQKKRILLSKKGWCHGIFIMSDKPIKFHDYNF
jgi:hypothetical protein